MGATTNCYAYPRSHYILTPEDWQTILAMLQDGFTITGAAKAVGATRQAVYERINRDPEFAEAVLHCKHEGTDFYVDLMRQKALDPKAGFLANIAMLRARDPARWSDKAQERTLQLSQVPAIHITINVPPAHELPPALRQIVQGKVEEVREPTYNEAEEGGYDADGSTE